MYYDAINFHTGLQLILSLIQQKLWFVEGHSVYRQQLRMCLKYLRLNLRSSPQLMGDLPTTRFLQIRVFNIVGLDFAGSFYTNCSDKWYVTKFKSYIYLFICTATKAVHLEMVSNCFLAALLRFISRKDCPSKIISDNSPTLKELPGTLRNYFCCVEKVMQNFSYIKGIERSFILPLYISFWRFVGRSN